MDNHDVKIKLKEEKKFSRIFFIVTGIIVSVIIYFIGMIMWPEKIVEIKEVKILTPKVKSGDNVEFFVDYCKYKDIEAKAKRRLICEGSTIWLTSEPQGKAPLGCRSANVSMQTPEGINPGMCYIDTEITYEINIFKTLKEDFQSPKFEIVK